MISIFGELHGNVPLRQKDGTIKMVSTKLVADLVEEHYLNGTLPLNLCYCYEYLVIAEQAIDDIKKSPTRPIADKHRCNFIHHIAILNAKYDVEDKRRHIVKTTFDKNLNDWGLILPGASFYKFFTTLREWVESIILAKEAGGE